MKQRQNTFSVTLAEFLRQIITLLIGIGVLAWLAPRLSLIMLGSVPVVVLVAMIFGRFIRRFSRERQDRIARSTTIAEEVLQHFQIVKSFHNEYLESVCAVAYLRHDVGISIRSAEHRGLLVLFGLSPIL